MIIHPRLIALGVIMLLALAAAGIFLSTSTIDAPRHTIEKIIPNDHFFK